MVDFCNDGEHALMTSSVGRETTALTKVKLSDGSTTEVIAFNDKADCGGIMSVTCVEITFQAPPLRRVCSTASRARHRRDPRAGSTRTRRRSGPCRSTTRARSGPSSTRS